jgi:hypothetical protein
VRAGQHLRCVTEALAVLRRRGELPAAAKGGGGGGGAEAVGAEEGGGGGAAAEAAAQLLGPLLKAGSMMDAGALVLPPAELPQVGAAPTCC